MKISNKDITLPNFVSNGAVLSITTIRVSYMISKLSYSNMFWLKHYKNL